MPNNSMFDNYDNLQENYVPNNLVYKYPIGKCPTKLSPIDCKRPYEDINALGELVGYYWYYGDTVNLSFEINGEITVDSRSILYTITNQAPGSSTKGFVGEKAYNLVDKKSWTCTSIILTQYTWTEDDEFTYPVDGDKDVYMDASDYVKDKVIEIALYNFRNEKIYEQTFAGDTNVTMTIDECLSKKMQKGVYTCSLTLIDSVRNTYERLIDQSDFTLTVR